MDNYCEHNFYGDGCSKCNGIEPDKIEKINGDFIILEWEEETSIFDPKGEWKTPEYKSVTIKVEVPSGIVNDNAAILVEDI